MCHNKHVLHLDWCVRGLVEKGVMHSVSLNNDCLKGNFIFYFHSLQCINCALKDPASQHPALLTAWGGGGRLKVKDWGVLEHVFNAPAMKNCTCQTTCAKYFTRQRSAGGGG